MTSSLPRLLTAASVLLITPALLADTVTTTFDSGAEGWVGPSGPGGATVLEPDTGNPGGAIHTTFQDFGISFRNSSNPDFIKDYSQFDDVTFSVDVEAAITDFNGDTWRPLMVEFRDYDNPPAGYPWVSVWYHFEWITTSGWTTWAVTIDDPSATDLPAGWGGFGAESGTGEPLLPADRTFADVLAGVDEIVVGTLEPGWFFTMVDFDIRLDNITVTTTSTPPPADTVTTTFDDGAEGWVGPTGPGGATVVEPDTGNPGGAIHTTFQDFGISFRNSSNPDFIKDYSQFDSVEFSVDVEAVGITDFNGDTFRPLLVEFRDYTNPPAGYPWVSVWYHFEWITTSDWTTWSVMIDDPSATELPAGWGGFGAESGTGEPLLPADRTFADVLAGVDEIVVGTLEPGWFFTMVNFDVRLDNITVTTTGGATPCPADVDGNGDVGFSDLVSLLASWGPCPGCPADVNGDENVGFDDLVSLLASWGPCI